LEKLQVEMQDPELRQQMLQPAQKIQGSKENLLLLYKMLFLENYQSSTGAFPLPIDFID